MKTPLTLEITDGDKTKVVHVNRLRQRIVPYSTNKEEPSGQVLQEPHPNWEAPQIDHVEMPASTVPLPVHREPQDVVQDLQDYAVQPEHQELVDQENAPVDQQHITEERRYPERIRRPPERY